MKKAISVLLTFVMVFSMVNAGTMEVQAKSKTKSKKVVVIYFSATGTTKGAAKRIQKKTKGKLIEIKAADPYTDDDLDYGDDDSRVVKEHESASSPAKSKVRPKISNLKEIKKAVKKADVAYIGYPIWWADLPMPVYSFLQEYDFGAKTIIPFITHGGSGASCTVDTISNLQPGALMMTTSLWGIYALGIHMKKMIALYVSDFFVF